MNFKEYVENKKRELHADIIADICININNCASCYSDIYKRVECNPINCMNVFQITKNSFCIELYEGDVCRRLLDIAENHGYKMGIVCNKDFIEEHIIFYK